MKNFVVLVVFLATMIFGLIVSTDFTNKSNSDFAHSTNETFENTFFTLLEANRLTGKKVISKNRNFRNGETGRIISFEMIAPDKFLIEVYWGKGALDENSTVTFHCKESFSGEFRVLD